MAVKTTDEDPLRSEPVGLAVSCEENQGAYIPLAHVYCAGRPEQPGKEKVFAVLRGALEDKDALPR
jgi:DNA polymerase I-like protein with 3'-5' exonuclease and polymerase domains